MVVECICISVILLIIFVGFLRSKYRSYAFALLPLLALPVIHLVGMLFVFGLGFCPEEYRVVALSIVDLVGLVIGCVCCALLSSFIETKRGRTLFIIVCCVFQLALASAFVVNSIAQY